MGITEDPRWQRLWQDAQTKGEWATTRLWEYTFRIEVFKGKNWAISSQQPPTDDPTDRRRVDLVAEFADDAGNWKRVLFMEAKTASATSEELATVERQAFTACCAYLHYFRGTRICAVTCFGGKARIWVYERDQDYLIPYVPAHGTGIGARDEYIELYSAEGQQIIDGLKYIRDNHVPPANTLPSQSSPRPSNASLPYDWHDREVPFVARSSASQSTQMAGVEYTQQSYTLVPSVGSSGVAISSSVGGKAPPSGSVATSSSVSEKVPLSGSGTKSQDSSSNAPSSLVPGGPSNTTSAKATLSASRCIYVKVVSTSEKNGQTFYRCSPSKGKDIELGRERWYESTIDYSTGVVRCWACNGNSGSIYYTWNFDV